VKEKLEAVLASCMIKRPTPGQRRNKHLYSWCRLPGKERHEDHLGPRLHPARGGP